MSIQEILRSSLQAESNGGPKDLRSFLRQVESAEGMVRISREVSPVHELSAVVKKLELERGNPVAVFEKVNGSELPVAVSVQGTRERIALALGQPVGRCVEWFMERLESPIPSQHVESGPVHDVKYLGDDVDLGVLPLGVHAAEDGGRYFTSGCVLVRDPATGNTNTGVYRMMVKGERRITVTTGLPHDLAKVIQYGQEHDVPIEFAIVLGHHPALLIGSQAKNPMTLDALALSGALMGEPMLVTRAQTVEIDVPAYAEIVVEGRILPGEREMEGPFGEFTYYYGSSNGHVAEITAITHREDAIFVDLHPTHNEHRCLWIFPGREARLLAKLRDIVPGVTRVHIPFHGAGMSAYVALDKKHDGDGKRVLMITLSSDNYLKHAIVVDSDVDIFDTAHVLWALNLRFQGDRDLMILPNSQGISVDPSSYSLTERYKPGGLTTKVGFDATMPVEPGFPIRADLIPEPYTNLDLDDYVATS
jgi:2,5-furandicarboxylate decarboxylase 1